MYRQAGVRRAGACHRTVLLAADAGMPLGQGPHLGEALVDLAHALVVHLVAAVEDHHVPASRQAQEPAPGAA
jgi:hypothetical protein